jgi:hypothetical protein
MISWAPVASRSAAASSVVRWSWPSIEMNNGNLRLYEGSADQYLQEEAEAAAAAAQQSAS